MLRSTGVVTEAVWVLSLAISKLQTKKGTGTNRLGWSSKDKFWEERNGIGANKMGGWIRLVNKRNRHMEGGERKRKKGK